MTALYCDGFDTYSSLNERWGNTGLGTFDISALNPRTGTHHYRSIAATSENFIRRSFPAGGAHPTIIIQFAVLRTTSLSTHYLQVGLYSAGLVEQTFIRLLTTGAIELRRAAFSGGTLLGSSAGATLAQNTWGHVAWKCTLGDTGATSQIWINSNLVYNGTGLDTRVSGTDANYDSMTFMSSSNSGQTFYLDDVVIMNGAGSRNNDFIGDVAVLPRVVNGAGDRTELTPFGSATNWQNVDEARHDGVEYNGSATPGLADLYTMQDVPAGSTISFVQQTMYAGKNEAGVKNAAPIVKSAGTEYPQAAVGVPVGFNAGPTLNVYESDPATSAAWTVAGFNAAQFGLEVRS